jgi:ABC-type multidrug transport system permease subunit
MEKFAAIFHARNMEFIRDRGTLIWNLLFPVLLVFGFAFAFGGGSDNVFTVGYFGGSLDQARNEAEFFSLDHIEFIEYEDRGEALERVRYHQIDMLVDISQGTYFVNESATNGYLVEQLLTGSDGEQFTKEAVTGDPIRFVDFLVPGIIGMNMMFSGVFGVGFVLVRYRKNGVLKRLKATPVGAFQFVSAQVASRFVIVVISSVVVFAATNFFLNFMMLGSYLLLFLLTAVAVFCMISLGLIFATRIKSEELASGLMNIITLPMLLLSGVFFSLEGTPAILQTISRIFPLTHFVQGARSIMLEGAGLVEMLPNFAILGGFTLVFLAVASLLFRWE